MLVAGVVAVALVLGGLAVVDRLRGGASSPDVLAERVVTALDREDLPALVRLVEPGERAALVRLAGALTSRLDELALPTAVGGPGPAEGRPLEGVDLALTGAAPRVEAESGDVALVDLGDLSVRVRSTPAAAHGLLRVWFDHQQAERASDLTYRGSTLPSVGTLPRLVAVERSGRWYLSVVGTLIGPGVGEDTALTVRTLPPSAAPTPEAAVEATLGVLLDGRAPTDVSTLARTLDRAGSDVVQLWGSVVSTTGLPASAARVEALTTSAGPVVDDRAVVRVTALHVGGTSALEVGDGCATLDGTRTCLRPSGYHYVGGTGSLGFFELLGHDGSFSLTAVRDGGGWRTSLPESLADALVGYADGLTREQVLMVLGAERLDTPGGDLQPEVAQQAVFTSGGYALRSLHLDRAGLYRVMPSPAGANRASIYDADGQPSIQPFYPNDSVYRLAAGDHTVLVWADDAFSATLREPAPAPYLQEVEVRSVG